MSAPQEDSSPVSRAKEPVWATMPGSAAAPPPPPKASQLPGSDPTAGIAAPRRASVPVKLMWVTPLVLAGEDQFLVPVLLMVTVPVPENVAPGAVEAVPAAPLISNTPPTPAAPQVKGLAPVLKTVLPAVAWLSTRLLAPPRDTAPDAPLMSRAPQIRLAPKVLAGVDPASHVAVSAAPGATPSAQAVPRLRLSPLFARMTGAACKAADMVMTKAVWIARLEAKRVFIGGVVFAGTDRTG